MLGAPPTSSPQRLHLGLPGYLIRFVPLGFVPDRRIRSSVEPSQQVVLSGWQDFTPTLRVPHTSPGPKSGRPRRIQLVERVDLPTNVPDRLRTF